MKYFIISMRSLLVLSFTFMLDAPIQAQNTTIQQSLWTGIGGKSTWKQTDYILFVVKGNEIASNFSGARKFLLNKTNGDARFEGMTSQNEEIVVLFNYITQKAKKIFRNKKEVKNYSHINSIFASMLLQFNEDSSLLFLQTFLDKSGSTIGKSENKIANSQKLTSIPFKVNNLLNKSLNGKIYFNTETFQIRNINYNEDEYLVDGYKDVGGGLTLPTIFKNISDTSKSCTYPTVASFTEMEESRFSNL